mmetsp:Transcript_7307/g.12744  ORF Transcript_7307/g.12744 Transcript_7307/m.12744 type:complete len:364 (+) Transcript_7307:226-1317(+)
MASEHSNDVAEEFNERFQNEDTVVGQVAQNQIYQDGQVNELWVLGDGSEFYDEEEYGLQQDYDGRDDEEEGDGEGCECCRQGELRDDQVEKNQGEDSAPKDAPAQPPAGPPSSPHGSPKQTVEATAQPVDDSGASIAGLEEAEQEDLAPRYPDWKEHYPELQLLLDNIEDIKEELDALMTGRWTPWPEQSLYKAVDQNGDWKVIPLMHTFPAWNPARTRLIESNVAACPRTMDLLQQLPGLRTALFSRLGPKTRLSYHQGWADLSNHVIRIHLPLVMPNQRDFPNSCGMVVEDEIKFHQPGELLAFDDSKLHKAFNASDEERVLLIFDLMRPENMPKGVAWGGHTEQLDMFINGYEDSLKLFN